MIDSTFKPKHKDKELVPTIEFNVRKEILENKGKWKKKIESKRSID